MPSKNPLWRWPTGRLAAATLAALVLAVTAGGIAAALSRTHAHSAAPTRTPLTTPTPTTRTTTPAAKPPAPRTSTKPTRPPVPAHALPAATNSDAQSAPSRPTKRLTIPGYPKTITLSVPLTWRASRTLLSLGCGCGSPQPIVCLVATGDYARNPNNCVLVVQSTNHAAVDHDRPLPSIKLPKCGSWTTSDEATVTVSGIAAEYRQFTDRCDGSRSEQWVLSGAPSVAFWHPINAASTRDDVLRAIESATIPARTNTAPSGDTGYVRSLVQRADGVHVIIDRVVESLDGTVINYNPATYDYRVAIYTGGRAPNVSCTKYLPECTGRELLARFAKGPRPSDGSQPLDGALVRVYGGPAARYDLNLESLTAFKSHGDTGHGCGC